MIASERLEVEVACRVVLGVSSAGFYAWRSRPPAARSVRHAWLTDVIREIHTASYGSYRASRVHAELVLGRGIRVGHNAVAMLMRPAGIAGRMGARKWKGMPGFATAEDLVDRIFHREGPNQLWVTDITEHSSREGKVYCAVVLDAFSRRVVGWSTATTQRPQPNGQNPTAALTSNALRALLATLWRAVGNIAQARRTWDSARVRFEQDAAERSRAATASSVTYVPSRLAGTAKLMHPTD